MKWIPNYHSWANFLSRRSQERQVLRTIPRKCKVEYQLGDSASFIFHTNVNFKWSLNSLLIHVYISVWISEIDLYIHGERRLRVSIQLLDLLASLALSIHYIVPGAPGKALHLSQRCCGLQSQWRDLSHNCPQIISDMTVTASGANIGRDSSCSYECVICALITCVWTMNCQI